MQVWIVVFETEIKLERGLWKTRGTLLINRLGDSKKVEWKVNASFRICWIHSWILGVNLIKAERYTWDWNKRPSE